MPHLRRLPLRRWRLPALLAPEVKQNGRVILAKLPTDLGWGITGGLHSFNRVDPRADQALAPAFARDQFRIDSPRGRDVLDNLVCEWRHLRRPSRCANQITEQSRQALIASAISAAIDGCAMNAPVHNDAKAR
jgi:hypothetical protein